MSLSPIQEPPKQNRANAMLGAFFKNETLSYVVKRLLQGLLTLLLASFLSFFVVYLAPGDYLTPVRADPEYPKELIDYYTELWRLDEGFLAQYFGWLHLAFQGDFGQSFAYKRPVFDLLKERMPNTLLLSVASIVVTWAIAIPFGIVGAVNQDRFLDKALRILSYIGQGFPTIVTGLLLLFFAQLTTPLFPVGGRTSLYHDELNWIGRFLDVAWHLILPTIALSITSFAGLQRIMRGQMLDVLRQDYIQTARAKGLSENKVIYIHALRNAVNPLITILGFEFASLLSGSFIIENYFSWPGLGTLSLQAVQTNDLPLVMAILVLGAIMLIAGNLLADLLLSFVDPRIKLSRLN